MISVIIPTLFKCNLLHESIKKFKENLKENDELILIDNANSSYDYNSENIRHIKYSTNNFVNPSWNIGVEQSKNNIIVIANDDILFNYVCYRNNILNLFNKTQNVGIIGFDQHFFEKINLMSINKAEDLLEFKITKSRTTGFGMLMSMRKENYHIIPDTFKIFCGDDFLFYKNLKNGFDNYLCDIKLYGSISHTSRDFISNLKREKNLFKKMFP